MFKSFAIASAKAFHLANPWFANRKLRAYSTTSDVVAHPRVLHVWDRNRRPKVDDELPDAFVLKADGGHSARSVWILRRVRSDAWTDLLRGATFTHGDIVNLALGVIEDSRTGICFAEESLADEGRLPPDFKVYTLKGEVRCILVVRRRGSSIDVGIFDSEWHALPLLSAFAAPEAEDWSKDVPRPPSAISAELARVSRRLAYRHRADFCRYDYYVHRDAIWLGEISPFCGALYYWNPTDILGRILGIGSRPLVPGVREEYRQDVLRTVASWLALNPRQSVETIEEVRRRVIHAMDLPAPEVTVEDMRSLVRVDEGRAP